MQVLPMAADSFSPVPVTHANHGKSDHIGPQTEYLKGHLQRNGRPEWTWVPPDAPMSHRPAKAPAAVVASG